MALELTWDLFIGVFMLVILAYSFIVGINGTIKVLLSSYIGILVVEGLYAFITSLISAETIKETVSMFEGDSGLALLKIGLFIIAVVLLTTRGRFEPDFQSDSFYSLESVFIPIFGLFLGALIVGVIILYGSGGTIFSGLEVLSSDSIKLIAEKSIMVKIITESFYLLFALPAICLIALSFLESD